MKADEISTRLLDFWQGQIGFRSVICIMITVADVSICASIFNIEIEIEIRENKNDLLGAFVWPAKRRDSPERTLGKSCTVTV